MALSSHPFFLGSAARWGQYPDHSFGEIAIAGRSNAGKSSLVNALLISKVAKVSASPGKTRLINFYRLKDQYVIVDLPGYGFAKGSSKEIAGWKKMIEEYLSKRESLVAFVLVMDVRRKWTDQEDQLFQFCKHLDLKFGVVQTKIDKLGKVERAKQLRALRQESSVENIWQVSTKSGENMLAFKKEVYQNWIKGSQ
ncbi:MAG: ribosome biogenesis GTP-binding protein YsxC [Bdellovibrionales bacterium CG10_big_fil_rev_8_21_14_0_10_45_34]|nr:MAG: ribosome biogenesis GTP-binding protein YsxC [Bdellovibrionales bacterium CG10_big_fil_rev_8_21_14_0_10_45_34]